MPPLPRPGLASRPSVLRLAVDGAEQHMGHKAGVVSALDPRTGALT
jgi:hypothetical protein